MNFRDIQGLSNMEAIRAIGRNLGRDTGNSQSFPTSKEPSDTNISVTEPELLVLSRSGKYQTPFESILQAATTPNVQVVWNINQYYPIWKSGVSLPGKLIVSEAPPDMSVFLTFLNQRPSFSETIKTHSNLERLRYDIIGDEAPMYIWDIVVEEGEDVLKRQLESILIKLKSLTIDCKSADIIRALDTALTSVPVPLESVQSNPVLVILADCGLLHMDPDRLTFNISIIFARTLLSGYREELKKMDKKNSFSFIKSIFFR